MLVFHDLMCDGCGHIVKAPRRGTVPGTILGPEGVALVGSLKQHCRVTAGGSLAASSATRRGSRPAAPPPPRP